MAVVVFIGVKGIAMGSRVEKKEPQRLQAPEPVVE